MSFDFNERYLWILFQKLHNFLNKTFILYLFVFCCCPPIQFPIYVPARDTVDRILGIWINDTFISICQLYGFLYGFQLRRVICVYLSYFQRFASVHGVILSKIDPDSRRSITFSIVQTGPICKYMCNISPCWCCYIFSCKRPVFIFKICWIHTKVNLFLLCVSLKFLISNTR